MVKSRHPVKIEKMAKSLFKGSLSYKEITDNFEYDDSLVGIVGIYIYTWRLSLYTAVFKVIDTTCISTNCSYFVGWQAGSSNTSCFLIKYPNDNGF